MCASNSSLAEGWWPHQQARIKLFLWPLIQCYSKTRPDWGWSVQCIIFLCWLVGLWLIYCSKFLEKAMNLSFQWSFFNWEFVRPFNIWDVVTACKRIRGPWFGWNVSEVFLWNQCIWPSDLCSFVFWLQVSLHMMLFLDPPLFLLGIFGILYLYNNTATKVYISICSFLASLSLMVLPKEILDQLVQELYCVLKMGARCTLCAAIPFVFIFFAKCC